MLFLEELKTPIGILCVIHDGEVLCHVSFKDREQRRLQELAKFFPNARVKKYARKSEFIESLQRYFAGELQSIDLLKIARVGTPFQQRVWKTLRKVPAGETRSYGEMARLLGNAEAARAVGHANGANPISIVVPCHRLIASDGSLVRYGGGLRRKKWLIAHEATCSHAMPR